MYCNSCGNKMNEQQVFCTGCGNRSGAGMAAPSQMIYVREKSAGIAAILSFLWAGLGQLYVGRIGRGLALMLVHFMLMFIGAAVVLGGALFGGIDGAIGAGTIFLIVWTGTWIWNVFDAHKLANKYNDSQRASGRRPW